MEGVASWAMDEPPSLGIWPGFQEFQVILREGWSPVFCLNVPPKEGFQSRALGPGDWKTQTRVRMGVQGAWEAPYAGSWSSH